ncbi:hypothetical protein ABZ897_29940 [Nonomuraea sp. NPDC046802]|uniref:hypothetical protein n=1 Tax=Nonomuraea sp. NPDC046802 TaxID=3154919 RepID=UPI0033E41A7C
MVKPLEIACDESGAEGEKLVGGNTDVFAHAGVLMEHAAAAACIAELRARAPSPASQYKANHILREKHGAALRWMLSPSGPVLGHVHVFLVDKAFHMAGKIAELLAADAPLALALYREGRAAFGPGRWTAFLEAFNYLLRAKNGQGVIVSVEDAYRLVDELRGTGGPAGEIMELLWRARPRVEDFHARLLSDPHVLPALDPLMPAIVRAAVHWGAGGRPVSIVHDRQTTLTEERVALMRRMAGEGRLAGFRLVESTLDARVQVADVVAGVARKVASDELNGRGDPGLSALLRPYLDATSIWAGDLPGEQVKQQ